MEGPQPLTREDLRDELHRFAVGTLRQDLPDIFSQVREELREELHLCFLEWSPLPTMPERPPRSVPAQPDKPVQDDDIQSALTEDPEGVLPQGLAASQPGRLVGSEADDLSPLDLQVDTEALPRPIFQLAKEATQGSPPGPHDKSVVSGTSTVRTSRTSARSSTMVGRQKVSIRSSQSSAAASNNRRSASSQFSWSPGDQGVITEKGGFFHRHYRKFMHTTVFRSSESILPRRSVRSSRASVRLAAQGPRMPPPAGGPLARMVQSAAFDYGTGLLILLNAASIGFQTDYMARSVTNEVPPAFRGLEIFFCALFTTELLLRITALGTRFFCSPDWVWNIFDCLLVALQLTEELMALIAKVGESDPSVNTDIERKTRGKDLGKDFSMMRILRILRLIRIIRLVRILRLIGELRTIVVSIAGSLRSLCWTVLLLMMMMYLVGVYMTQLILDYRVDKNISPSTLLAVDLQEQSALTHFFGSLGMAMISLYQAITGGLNWHMLVDPLMGQISPWLSVLIGLYIAFSLFALMNVVTGVFVESALATAKSDRDMFLLQFVRKLFQEADKDASGAITWEEFKACLSSQEMQMYFEAFDLDIHEAKNLFQLLDIDRSGQVDFEEFVNGCFRLRGPAKALDLATFMSGFTTWNNEWVNFAKRVDWQLRTVLKSMNVSMKDAPKFRAKLTTINAPGGMTLLSTDEDTNSDSGNASEAEWFTDGDKSSTDKDNTNRSSRHTNHAFFSEEDFADGGQDQHLESPPEAALPVSGLGLNPDRTSEEVLEI